MNVKMTFTIPEELAEKLKQAVHQKERSAFVKVALEEKLQRLDQQQFEHDLIEAYVERYDEDESLNEEWEQATIKSWQ
jgi:Arc/MetJ-type ribon-helix-helix transcriptional regulator